MPSAFGSPPAHGSLGGPKPLVAASVGTGLIRPARADAGGSATSKLMDVHKRFEGLIAEAVHREARGVAADAIKRVSEGR